MKTLLKLCVNGAIASWFTILWLHMMLLSSDIPISISPNEMQDMVITLLVSTIAVLLYVKLTSNTRLLYFLLIPSFLWGSSMVQSIVKDYHEYDTIISITGFISSMLIVTISILKDRRFFKSS